MSKSADISLICACFCGFQAFIVLTCILLILPIYLLIVGIIKMDSCPVDSRIPIWMMATSALMIIERMMEAMNQAMEVKFMNNNPKPPELDGKQKRINWDQKRKENRSLALFGLISFSRFAIFISIIVGSVFVFSSFSNRSQCDTLLYWSAFVSCILFLSFSIIGLIVLGSMFLILAILHVKPKRTN